MMNIGQYMRDMGKAARRAAERVAFAPVAERNLALHSAAGALRTAEAELLAANQRDLESARQSELAPALRERLELNSDRVEAMAVGLEQVAALPDPVGAVSDLRSQPSGIRVGRMRVPLGVIGIIYESRPNVTADAAALCLKSGNAVILRGGSESVQSNLAIATCLHRGLAAASLPEHAVQVVAHSDRAAVGELLGLSEYVDMIVPRGGRGLIERVNASTRIPVLSHLDGICHVYLDDAADPERAQAIALNAKTQRYGVCNAMETLLVAQSVARQLLVPLGAAYREAGVELRACPAARELLGPGTIAASEADWSTEYLAPVLSVRVVAGLEEAIAHINRYGSAHTDCIVTEHQDRAWEFLRRVDSGSVLVNASTRFADGFEYGLGAEIGISTDKLHARGPVGLEGLTSSKFIVLGDGQVRC